MHVSVARWIDEGAPGGIMLRGTRRVVAVVYGNGAGADRDQAGAGMRMPPGAIVFLTT